MKIKKTLFPVEECVYFKLYINPNHLSEIAECQIYRFFEKLKKHNVFSHYFFIRYTDPDYHIRLRFFYKPKTTSSKKHFFIDSILRYLRISNSFEKITIDTYDREVERYTASKMLNVEHLFFLESEFIINELSKIENKNRLFIESLKIFDLYVNLFDLNIEEKMSFITLFKDAYAEEFNYQKKQKKVIANSYRNLRTELEVLTNENIHEYELRIIGTIKDIILNITHHEKNMILSSIIHMFYNRLFSTNQREIESIAYQLLFLKIKSDYAQHIKQ